MYHFDTILYNGLNLNLYMAYNTFIYILFINIIWKHFANRYFSSPQLWLPT